MTDLPSDPPARRPGGRPRLPAWLLLAGAGLLLAAFAGLLVAVHWWPYRVVPYLPAQAVIWLAPVVPTAYSEILWVRFAEPQAESALLGILATDSPLRRRLLAVGQTGLLMPEAVKERLFALANAEDPAVRAAAREVIDRRPGGRLSQWLREGLSSGGPGGAFAPDGWTPGAEARQALVLVAFLDSGYDHKVPSRHRRAVAAALADLVRVPPGSITDARDRATVLMAVGGAYGLTLDPDLLAPMEALLASTAATGEEMAAWWEQDTTRAILQLFAWRRCLAGSVTMVSELAALEAGWRSALARHEGSLDWFAAGGPVGLSDAMRAGLRVCVGTCFQEDPATMGLTAEDLTLAAIPLDLTGWVWATGAWWFDPSGKSVDRAAVLAAIEVSRVYAWRGRDLGPYGEGPPGDSLLRAVAGALSMAVLWTKPPACLR